MNGGLIPYRYAKALYKFALEHNTTETLYDEMRGLVSSFEANTDLLKVLSNPFVSHDDKQKLLITGANAANDNDFKGFVRLILDNHREMYAYEMALAYLHIYRDANKISSVKISTAAQLPDAEMQKLVSLVEKAFPNRTLEISTMIDPALIGGFVMDVDQVRMDASISSELENLRQTLLSTI